MALYIPGIQIVFGFIGATSANMLGFILPGAFFLKSAQLEEKKTKEFRNLGFLKGLAWFLIIFGSISLITCLVS